MLNLLIKDCKELWYLKKRISVILAVLIILIISTSYHVTGIDKNQNPKIRFGVADEDNSAYSKLLLEYFKNSESFGAYVTIIKGSQKDLAEDFNKGELDIYLIIPKEFAKNLISFIHLPVRVLINTEDTTKAVLLKTLLESYEKYIKTVEVNCNALYNAMQLAGADMAFINKKNIEISYELIFTALGKEKLFSYEEKKGLSAAPLADYYRYSILALFGLYFGLYYGYKIQKERNQGTLKRLYAAGVPIWLFILEKIVFSAVFLFSMLVLLYLLPAVFQNTDIQILVFPVLLLEAVFCITFALMISSIFNRSSSYMTAGNFICFLGTILGGGILPMNFIPKSLAGFSKLMPNYWFTRIMIDLQKGIDNRQTWFILFCFILAAGCFIMLSIVNLGREEGLHEE